MRILITGANGHIGVKLIRHLVGLGQDIEVVALVRSETAAATTLDQLGVEATVVDYRDAAALATAGVGCDVVIHLVGIIKESLDNTFQMAHEDTCQAIVDAGLSVKHIICLGINGGNELSDNKCLASRGRAEQMLFKCEIPATVIQVPMVLGEDDFASKALARSASKKLSFTFRASSIEQPIYSGDVIKAIVNTVELVPENRLLRLAGPESLSRRALIKKAGAYFDNRPTVISLPLSVGLLMARLMELTMRTPPVTRAMLEVLDHDDVVDVSAACEVLKLEVTTLDVAFEKLFSH